MLVQCFPKLLATSARPTTDGQDQSRQQPGGGWEGGQTYEAKDASGSSHSDGVTKDKGSRGASQA